MNKKISVGILVVAIIVIVLGYVVVTGLFIDNDDDNNENNLDRFAKCLTSKGAKMYGADWCGHCKNQKEMFGDSFQYIDYVECTEETEACKAAGISGYPTWIINGMKYPGEKTLEELASLSGCEL